ncbi:PilZ domain-containing protein [Candidatus Nitrospira inopinata]|nr:PilZ domain-containing protein [Candidatus Nitrospira inopinata]
MGRPAQASSCSSDRLQARDRRDQPRFHAQFRSSLSGQHQEGHGRTMDISAGGCKIESDLMVAEGTTLECRIHVPGLDWPLRIDEATVRWTDGKTFGLRFSKISPQELEKLEAVLDDLEREA